MGNQARKIVGLDIKEVIEDLNKAYCDEWLAFYLYWYMAQTVSGPAYEDLQEFLKKLAKDELEHAEEVADRIVKLGGVPLSNPLFLEKNANLPYVAPPQSTGDVKQLIQAVLKAEAGAIDVYQKLAQKTFGKDHATYTLVTHILSEEIDHEETFENLLES